MKYEIYYSKKLSPFSFGSMGKPESKADISKWYRKVHSMDFYGKNIQDNLDRIFHMFNIDKFNPLSSIEGQNRIKKLNVAHTSMSVGDIIKVDGKIWYCDKIGWTEMNLPKQRIIMPGKGGRRRAHWVEGHNRISKKGKMFYVNHYRRWK